MCWCVFVVVFVCVCFTCLRVFMCDVVCDDVWFVFCIVCLCGCVVYMFVRCVYDKRCGVVWFCFVLMCVCACGV